MFGKDGLVVRGEESGIVWCDLFLPRYYGSHGAPAGNMKSLALVECSRATGNKSGSTGIATLMMHGIRAKLRQVLPLLALR